MTRSPFINKRIIQNSWIVRDLNVAVDRWLKTTGIGPFYLVKGVTIEDQLYRGQPTQIEVSYALAQAGDIQIELVCQLNDIPSAYRDTVPADAEMAFHHMAIYTGDYDADLSAYTAAGAEVAFSGGFAGKRFCYVDTFGTIGCMMELIEHSEAQEEFFTLLRQSARDWDGSHPIRDAF